MKILVIGDIHGHNTWKKIIYKERDNVDKIVLLGDYMDSFDIPVERQVENYYNIIEEKGVLGNKLVLLVGNHDFHYIDNSSLSSGYKDKTYDLIHNIIYNHFKDNIILPYYKYDNILFSHAGFSKTWCEEYNVKIDNIKPEDLTTRILDNPEIYHFQHRYRCNGYGDNIYQTPIWIRPDSLQKDKLEGYIQIVGHTGQHINNKDNIFYCDSLVYDEYLKIDLDKGDFITEICKFNEFD